MWKGDMTVSVSCDDDVAKREQWKWARGKIEESATNGK